jgi:hypothetical protein
MLYCIRDCNSRLHSRSIAIALAVANSQREFCRVRHRERDRNSQSGPPRTFDCCVSSAAGYPTRSGSGALAAARLPAPSRWRPLRDARGAVRDVRGGLQGVRPKHEALLLPVDLREPRRRSRAGVDRRRPDHRRDVDDRQRLRLRQRQKFLCGSPPSLSVALSWKTPRVTEMENHNIIYSHCGCGSSRTRLLITEQAA